MRPAEFFYDIDSTGKVVVQYYYDAWGNHKVVDANGSEITDQSHIGNVNPFRYRGYYFDVETGLYYLQTRYYDPSTGRFLNRDSVQYADPESIHGLNLYAYCLNNPVNYTDPTGEFILSVFFLICLGVGVVTGGVLGGVTAAQNGTNILAGIFTGALLGGAVGAIIGLGGAYLMGGISSVASKLISDTVASIVSGTNCFGSWEDYAVAFIFGGLNSGLNINSGMRFLVDVAVNPMASQVAKLGTQGAELDLAKLGYNILSRALTFGFNGGKISLFGENANLLKQGVPYFTIVFDKTLARGFSSALWQIIF